MALIAKNKSRKNGLALRWKLVDGNKRKYLMGEEE
jgi:hypothetical protein